jgi:hypothetical protein
MDDATKWAITRQAAEARRIARSLRAADPAQRALDSERVERRIEREHQRFLEAELPPPG